MFKKFVSLALAVLLINLALITSAQAETKAEKETRFADSIKTGVIELGTGKDAKIQVKLKNGTKLRGYVSEIKGNSFVMIDEKTGATTEIPYPNAKQVRGNNLSTGAKIAIGLGILAGVLALLLFFENYG